jgi:hypothetical protein
MANPGGILPCAPMCSDIHCVLLDSTPMATAQTGEFTSQVPGSVGHAGLALQDQLQNARSGNARQTGKPHNTRLRQVELWQAGSRDVTTATGTKGKR